MQKGSIDRPRRIKEEPPTEIKKMPYRIQQQEEGDMFDTFSCSMDLLDNNYYQTNATQAGQKNSNAVTIESHRAPAQFIIPDDIELSKQDDFNRPSLLSEVPECKLPSPESKPTLLKGQFSQTKQEISLVNPYDLDLARSPQKGGEVEARLAICPESVDKKDCDSILDSPSPSKQQARNNWQISSPDRIFSPSPKKELENQNYVKDTGDNFTLQLTAIIHEKDEEESIPRINLFGVRHADDSDYGAVSLPKECEDSKSTFKTDSSLDDEDLDSDNDES